VQRSYHVLNPLVLLDGVCEYMITPTVPTFTDGDHDTADLQALSDAVRFLADYDYHPTWHFYKSASQSGATTTWSSVAFGSIGYDNDGFASAANGLVTIGTLGLYACEANVAFETTSSVIGAYAAFIWTAGPNNTDVSPGTQEYFGYVGGYSVSTTSVDTAYCLQDVCPMRCFPGDTIGVYFYTTATVTLNNNANQSYIKGRFVLNFTGTLIRLADDL
ncbi:MAG: hypothetical protein ACRD6W_05480, partial [Nitrososphaerales archaeon]